MIADLALKVPRTRVVVSRHGHAMGSSVHLVLTSRSGGDHPTADALVADASDAMAALDRLEARWSRFRPNSDVSRINRDAPYFVPVGADTFDLVTLAVAARGRTGGVFDPTLLRSLQAAGYDRSVETLPLMDLSGTISTHPEDIHGDAVPARSPQSLPPTGSTVRLRLDPLRCAVAVDTGGALDLGGIGKGRAADLLHRSIREAGALGACVNLGGDLRVSGMAPSGDGWIVDVDDPFRATEPLTTLVFGGSGAVPMSDDGLAVATSSTRRRRWRTSTGGEAHHLIDPRTGASATSDLVQVTVVARSALDAEVAAKALLIRGVRTPADRAAAEALLLDADASAIAMHRAGSPMRWGGIERWEWQP